MKPLYKVNQRDFDDYVPVVSESYGSWQIVTIALSNKCLVPYDEVIAKIIDIYNGVPGFVYNLGYNRIIAVVKNGPIDNYALIRKQLIDILAIYGVLVNVRSAGDEILATLQKSFLMDDSQYHDHYDLCLSRKVPNFMIADDDPMVLKLMKKILGSYGDVVTVTNGADVYERYSLAQPNVLFLDIHMPEVHGLQNLARITANFPFSYIFMISADSVAPRVLKGLEYGAFGFVGKPVQKERVLDFIKMCPTIKT